MHSYIFRQHVRMVVVHDETTSELPLELFCKWLDALLIHIKLMINAHALIVNTSNVH